MATVKATSSLNFLKFKVLKTWFCLMLPLALLPLALSNDEQARCGYVIILMIAYWVLQPVPIAVTALLPLILFPLMGVLTSIEVCMNYMTEPLMMFVGAVLLAIAAENCKLHERIALRVLLLIGSDIKWLMAGLMIITMVMSMWISNAATTAMMVAIVDAIFLDMCPDAENEGTEMCDMKESESATIGTRDVAVNRLVAKRSSENRSVRIVLLLSICYSANIGGTGTLTGTGTNLIFKGILEELYPKCEEITFLSWMMYNTPGMILCIVIGWLYLYAVYIKCSKEKYATGAGERVRASVACKYRKLGKVTYSESVVIILFFTLLLLWVFRDPKFISGWTSALGYATKVGDSVPSLFVAFLLFVIPSNPKRLIDGPALLDWKTAQRKLPWGIIILCGGGFSISSAAKKCGLSRLFGQKLSPLTALPPAATVAAICVMTSVVTEVVFNGTAANIFLPVFGEMAAAIKLNPLYLMLPVAISCSYTFMLPSAATTNAIVYEVGNMKFSDMAKPGFAMNIICCAVQLFMISTLGSTMFNVTEYPSWAPVFNSSSSLNSTAEMANAVNSTEGQFTSSF